MKTLSITALLVCYFATQSFSQNISIADFIKLRGANSNTLESKLKVVNIALYDQDELNNGNTQYTYKNAASTDVSNVQWVDYIAAAGNATWNNRIAFQIQNSALAKKYLGEMKDLGFYFMSKKIIDRQVFEVYSDGVNTIELITSQSRKVYDNNMYFNFALYSNSEYSTAFANENKKYNIAQIDPKELYAEWAGVPMSEK